MYFLSNILVAYTILLKSVLCTHNYKRADCKVFLSIWNIPPCYINENYMYTLNISYSGSNI